MHAETLSTIIRHPLLPLPLLAVFSHDPVFAAESRKPTASWQGLSRAYAKVRVFVGKTGFGWSGENDDPLRYGLIADAGVERNTARGFKLGFDLAPLIYAAHRPFISARLHLGYANESLAISMQLGSGLTWYYPQLGPVVRLGRFDGAHAFVRLSWSVYPPQPLPTDCDLDVSVPVAKRLRLALNLGGSYNSNASINAYGLAGVQSMLGGQGGRGTTLLTTSLGVTWTQFALGPMLALGIDERF